MLDIERFIYWYTNPLSRMSRLSFNVLLFLIFIPVMWLKMQGGAHTLSEKMETLAPALSNIEELKNNWRQPPADIQELIKRGEATRDLTEGIIDTLESKPAPTNGEKSLYTYAEFINLAIYAFLFPIMFMRMRDIGLRNTAACWTIALGAYSTLIFDALEMFNLYTLPFVPSAGIATLSFFMFMWLCSHKSMKREDHHRKNYMPGDTERDPY